MTTLRGIPFSPAFQASGATNFYGPGSGPGHGWWYHTPLHLFGLNFAGSTLVSKTTTLDARPGNMPLKKDGVTPKEWIPKCIIVNREKRAVLNAVSLSGPGLEFLLTSGEWHRQREPFFISVMSLAKKAEDRRAELRAIFERLAKAKREERFLADWGIQPNFSCPNGGVDPNDLVDEVVPTLEMADEILPNTIPLMPKFGPEIHPKSMLKICKAPRCDAISVFNTLPFGKHPAWAKISLPVDWRRIFGTDDPKESPMAKRFPGCAGGYSGAYMLHFLLEWLGQVRGLGVHIPICAGGGILSPSAAALVLGAGADAVSIGSMAMLAPTQVQKTIASAHEYVHRHRHVYRFQQPVTSQP